MLGQMRLSGRMYRDNEPTLESDKRDLAEALAQAIERLPQNIYRVASAPGRRPDIRTNHPRARLRQTQRLLQSMTASCASARRMSSVRSPICPSETRSRIRGLIQVRDAVRSCLRSQLDGSDEEQVAEARQQLNHAYDRFVVAFRPDQSSRQQRAFDGDPDLPLLLSLEHYNDETKTGDQGRDFSGAHDSSSQARLSPSVNPRKRSSFR